MDKSLKTIFYLVACVAVFIILVRIYNNPAGPVAGTDVFIDRNIAMVYFLDLNEIGNTTCEANGVARRVVGGGKDKARQVIDFLVKGLTKEEVNGGLGSAINPKTTLQKFEIKNDIAYIDFDSGLNPNIDDSCGAMALKSQITKTLKAVSSVNNVVISVNGKTEGVF